MLRIRVLGRVGYGEALALQRALHAGARDDYLLLLEHPHVITLGRNASPSHVLVDVTASGAQVVRTDRGGDVTYHGPGQLVGYPIMRVPVTRRSVPSFVDSVEQVVIEALMSLGLEAGRLAGFPGVWIDPDGENPRKIASVGVRISRGRSLHGFALNVEPDLDWFERIVPCGIVGRAVTSMRAEGVEAPMSAVIDAVCAAAATRWASPQEPASTTAERQDIVLSGGSASSTGDSVEGGTALHAGPAGSPTRLELRLRRAGVDPDAGLDMTTRKPPWLRVPARMGDDFHSLRGTVRELGLVTVCEEAGCPNIFECWADGTATFMINGDRCTRACGFCLVDTRRPLVLDPSEPARVAEAVARLGLAHAVVTAVARDDLPDGGAGAFADTVAAIREIRPDTAVELLISDCKGDEHALDQIFSARPDVLNHNLETVARLQRAVRPSAGYARSLSVLARAKNAGLVTKSGLILGLGETENEVVGALADLRAVGVDIVTIGQYLRPTPRHVPVARWWRPEDFDRLAAIGTSMGFAHVQASPLTRSSYHARQAATQAVTLGATSAVLPGAAR
ncbi:MAG: lipoyl synthase [Acidimicrobiales bacterium]